MSKKPRTPEEVQEVKQNILNKALELINEHGYKNFTMRKLAAKLNVTATTIYQYYENKDELYIAILAQGFEDLYETIQAAYSSGKTPNERIKLVCREYIKFGIYKPNFYNVMMILNEPKFNDYIGTTVEATASAYIKIAMDVKDFAFKVVEESGIVKDPTESNIEMATFEMLCTVHGFISLTNSKIIEYIFESRTKEINDEIIDNFIDTAVLNKNY